MKRIALAIRVFFGVLLNARLAEQVRGLLAPPTPTSPTTAPTPASAASVAASKPSNDPEATVRIYAADATVRSKPKQTRSEALSLLAALQREARFVDFIQEPITAYSDAQVGAAVRDIHKHCGEVLGRIFALEKVAFDAEGATVAVPAGAEAGKYRLVGNVTGQPPYRGVLCHHGWQATRCEIPEWTGGDANTRIVAPAEVELK